MNIIEEIQKSSLKKKVPTFKVGDTVDVHVKIKEGGRERIQIFNGIVIARQGSQAVETFTVRRIVQGEGVERIFPLHSPNIVNVISRRKGRPRRAKLYYLRQRTGKSIKVKERLGEIPGADTIDQTAKKTPAPEKETPKTKNE